MGVLRKTRKSGLVWSGLSLWGRDRCWEKREVGFG
jgi:hypothetical protein